MNDLAEKKIEILRAKVATKRENKLSNSKYTETINVSMDTYEKNHLPTIFLNYFIFCVYQGILKNHKQ